MSTFIHQLSLMMPSLLVVPETPESPDLRLLREHVSDLAFLGDLRDTQAALYKAILDDTQLDPEQKDYLLHLMHLRLGALDEQIGYLTHKRQLSLERELLSSVLWAPHNELNRIEHATYTRILAAQFGAEEPIRHFLQERIELAEDLGLDVSSSAVPLPPLDQPLGPSTLRAWWGHLIDYLDNLSGPHPTVNPLPTGRGGLTELGVQTRSEEYRFGPVLVRFVRDTEERVLSVAIYHDDAGVEATFALAPLGNPFVQVSTPFVTTLAGEQVEQMDIYRSGAQPAAPFVTIVGEGQGPREEPLLPIETIRLDQFDPSEVSLIATLSHGREIQITIDPMTGQSWRKPLGSHLEAAELDSKEVSEPPLPATEKPPVPPKKMEDLNVAASLETAVDPLLLTREERAAIYKLANLFDAELPDSHEVPWTVETGAYGPLLEEAAQGDLQRLYLRHLLAEDLRDGLNPVHDLFVRLQALELYRAEQVSNPSFRIPALETDSFRAHTTLLAQEVERSVDARVLLVTRLNRRLSFVDQLLSSPLPVAIREQLKSERNELLIQLSAPLREIVLLRQGQYNPRHIALIDDATYLSLLRLGMMVSQSLMQMNRRELRTESNSDYSLYETAYVRALPLPLGQTAQGRLPETVRLTSLELLKQSQAPNLSLNDLILLYLEALKQVDSLARASRRPQDQAAVFTPEVLGPLSHLLERLAARLNEYGLKALADLRTLLKLFDDLQTFSGFKPAFRFERWIDAGYHTGGPLWLHIFQSFLEYYWINASVGLTQEEARHRLSVQLLSRVLASYGLSLPEDLDEAQESKSRFSEPVRLPNGRMADRLFDPFIPAEAVLPPQPQSPLLQVRGDWTLTQGRGLDEDDSEGSAFILYANATFEVLVVDRSLGQELTISELNDGTQILSLSSLDPHFIPPGTRLDYNPAYGQLRLSGVDGEAHPFSISLFQDEKGWWQIEASGSSEFLQPLLEELGPNQLNPPLGLSPEREGARPVLEAQNNLYQRSGPVQLQVSESPEGILNSLAISHDSVGGEATFSLARVRGHLDLFLLSRRDDEETYLLGLQDYEVVSVSDTAVVLHLTNENGEIWTLTVDPRSGHIIASSGEGGGTPPTFNLGSQGGPADQEPSGSGPAGLGASAYHLELYLLHRLAASSGFDLSAAFETYVRENQISWGQDVGSALAVLREHLPPLVAQLKEDPTWTGPEPEGPGLEGPDDLADTLLTQLMPVFALWQEERRSDIAGSIPLGTLPNQNVSGTAAEAAARIRQGALELVPARAGLH